MRRAKLASLSLADLQKEIVRRQAVLPRLIGERDGLNCCIAELESLGGPAPAAAPAVRKRRRARKAKAAMPARAAGAATLRQSLIDVMTGQPSMSVPEIVEGVLASGYKTGAKTFRLIVNQMLSKGGEFRRVRRGRYALKA